MTRSGALTRAYGPALAMLEWSVGDDWDGESPEPVKQANPASWITVEGLAEQRAAVQDMAFRRFHANQWAASGQHWLPIGAWQACADPTAKILPGERIFVGVDVGGERSGSAVTWTTEDLRVDCAVFHGNEAVLECAVKVRELADDYRVAEVVFDPWRFQQGALELAERGVPIIEFPQSNARMGPASSIYFVQQQLGHKDIKTTIGLYGHPDQKAHAAASRRSANDSLRFELVSAGRAARRQISD